MSDIMNTTSSFPLSWKDPSLTSLLWRRQVMGSMPSSSTLMSTVTPQASPISPSQLTSVAAWYVVMLENQVTLYGRSDAMRHSEVTHSPQEIQSLTTFSMFFY